MYCSYNSKNNQIAFSWADNDQKPWLATYTIQSQKFKAATFHSLVASYDGYVRNDVSTCYNPVNNTFVFSWADHTGAPYLGVYKPQLNQLQINSFASLNTSYQSSVIDNVFACCNTKDEKIIFSSANTENSPLVSTYDFNTTTLSTNTLSTTIQSSANVYPIYNSVNNEVIAIWTDLNQNIYSAVLPGSGSTGSASIQSITELTGYPLGTNVDTLFGSYNPINNQIIINWPDATTNHNLWYTIYTFYLTKQASIQRLRAAAQLSSFKIQKRSGI